MSHRRHLHIFLKCIRICFLELFQLCCPCQWANNIDIDMIPSPFCRCNTGQTTNAFLCGSIRTLSIVSEQSCSRRKVNDRTLCFFQIRIASLHIVESCIQTRIHCQIELFCGVVCQGYTRGGSLCIVNQHMNCSECSNCLFHNLLDNGCIICSSVHICLYRQYRNAIQTFEFFFCIGQLLYVSASNDKVCTLFCKCGCNAVANRTALAVTQNGSACSGDHHCFFREKAHG